jgi:hypothetical protein
MVMESGMCVTTHVKKLVTSLLIAGLPDENEPVFISRQ